MPPAVKKALKEIGLSDKETAVLLVLLERGTMLVSGIARSAKLNRTTTYGILSELSARGLVSQVKAEGADRWQSIAPELLPSYIERRGQELMQAKQEVADAVSQIQLLRAKGKTLPKVQYFEGVDGVKQAYEDTLENNRGKMLRDITGEFKSLDEDWVNYYFQKRVRLGIRVTDLAPEGESAHRIKRDDTKHLRITKFLPAQYGFAAELAIYDNKVGIFSFAQEDPVALIIEDETISDMMKKLFDYIESTAK